MVDFLRANPYVNKEEYLWSWTVPQINLACLDFTHERYLSEEEFNKKKAKHINTAEDLLNDLGIPIIDKN